MTRPRVTPIGFRITNAIKAADSAGRGVDQSGPLGKGAESMFAGTYETVTCKCGCVNLAKLAVCTECRDVLPASENEQERRDAARCVARWALRHRGAVDGAQKFALEMWYALGLKHDPECDWEPRTITDRATGRRKRTGSAA